MPVLFYAVPAGLDCALESAHPALKRRAIFIRRYAADAGEHPLLLCEARKSVSVLAHDPQGRFHLQNELRINGEAEFSTGMLHNVNCFPVLRMFALVSSGSAWSSSSVIKGVYPTREGNFRQCGTCAPAAYGREIQILRLGCASAARDAQNRRAGLPAHPRSG